MGSLSKTQLDLLGDRLRKGEITDDDLRLLDAYRGSFGEAYEETVAAVRSSSQLQPTGRPAKSTTSIIEKLRRETIRLSQMQDIAGCRLVVESILVQDQVVEQLKSGFAKVAVVDRRKQPSFGYRAVHIIPTTKNRLIEIQVRTELQDLWAQLSERMSDALDPMIKYGGGDRGKTRDPLSQVAKAIATLEDLELQLPRKLAEAKQELRELLKKAIAGDFKVG